MFPSLEFLNAALDSNFGIKGLSESRAAGQWFEVKWRNQGREACPHTHLCSPALQGSLMASVDFFCWPRSNADHRIRLKRFPSFPSFPHSSVFQNSGYQSHEGGLLTDGITGCQSQKPRSRSFDPHFAKEKTKEQGAGVISLRPPRVAWRGQERGSGFPRRHGTVALGNVELEGGDRSL